MLSVESVKVNMALQFPKVEDAHLPRLMEIYNYYISYTTASFRTDSVSAEQMRQKLQSTQPVFQAFTIMYDTEIIGFCATAPWKAQDTFRNTAEVEIYLHKDFRGKGIGQKAFRVLEEYAAQNELHILLASVCTENYPAIKLLEKCSFSRCGFFYHVGNKFDRSLDITYYQKTL